MRLLIHEFKLLSGPGGVVISKGRYNVTLRKIIKTGLLHFEITHGDIMDRGTDDYMYLDDLIPTNENLSFYILKSKRLLDEFDGETIQGNMTTFYVEMNQHE